MVTNPFREAEERVATGGLAVRLVCNADPRTDPNGNVHRLPNAAAPNPQRLESPPDAAETDGEFDERLGRWAVLALFALTVAFAGIFLVVWLSGGAGIGQAVEEPRVAQPAPAPPEPLVQAAPALPPFAENFAPPAVAPVPYRPAEMAPPIAAPVPGAKTSAVTLSPGEIGALLSRGDALLNAGDVAAARPLLERAALAGDGTAALRLGQSYDPDYLAESGLREAAGNLGLAIFWYRRGQELGNGTAAFLARKLETAARAAWRSATPDLPPRHRPRTGK